MRHITRLIGREYTLDLRPFVVKKKIKGCLEVQKKKHCLKFLSGHFRYNSLWIKLALRTKWNSKKQALYIASVRHPIARLNSLFRYLKTRPRHHLYNHTIEKNDFDGFIHTLIASNSSFVNNGMCAQLSGYTFCNQSLLEKAKEAFDNHYLAIVPYDKTHELANIFAETLLLPHVKNRIVNASMPGEHIIPSKETLLLLEEKCQYDIQLYNYILKGYQAKLENTKKQLQNLMMKK